MTNFDRNHCGGCRLLPPRHHYLLSLGKQALVAIELQSARDKMFFYRRKHQQIIYRVANDKRWGSTAERLLYCLTETLA